MDINMIKRIGFIVAGGVIGGGIGYFIGNLIVNQLEKRAQELEWAKEDAEAEGKLTISVVEDGKVVGQKEVTVKKDYTKYAKKELSELVKPYTSTISSTGEKDNKKYEKINIISSDEYEHNRTFNKEPISYYEDDTTFANAQEEIVDDSVRLFGPNAHLHFGEESNDPDIVYIRNENNGVDYEIVRIHNSYSVVVMGTPADPPKETKAKRRKSVRKVNAHDDEDNEDETV